VRILAACSLGGAGHLRPLAPFLDEARRAGWETLVAGPLALGPLVEATGHPFRPGGQPAEPLIRPIREKLAVAPPAQASVLGNRELFGRVAAPRMLSAAYRAIRDWRPDVILRDPCEYASAAAAADLGRTAHCVAISLAGAEWGSIEAAGPALEELRPGLTAAVRASPYLTRFPAALDSSPFPRTVRYREPAPAPGGRLPSWWGPAHAGAPLVYATLGTVLGRMSFARECFRAVLDAVAGLPARVLLTTGHGFDPARLPDVPANVHVEQWVDQADVLPEAALVVCHGGSGTTFGALAAGVPLVVVPVFGDQFANGPQVAAAGAGLQVTVTAGDGAAAGRVPFGRGDSPLIRQAAEAVLHDGGFAERAALIAARMRGAPAIGDLLPLLAGH
jgi:hypothetical protein